MDTNRDKVQQTRRKVSRRTEIRDQLELSDLELTDLYNQQFKSVKPSPLAVKDLEQLLVTCSGEGTSGI